MGKIDDEDKETNFRYKISHRDEKYCIGDIFNNTVLSLDGNYT